MAIITIEGAKEWRDHWPAVVAACLATSLPTIYLYPTSIMIPQLQAEMGWSRAQISSGPAIVAFAAVLLVPAVGLAIDRFGARRLGLIGAPFFLLALAGLAFATAEPWTWWLLWGVVALGAAATSPAVWTTGVSSLFASSRGLALAVTLAGTGLGTMSVPLLAQWLVSNLGWRGTYGALALIWALVLIPLVLFFRSARDLGGREDFGSQDGATRAFSGMTAREAILSARFLLLAIGASGIVLICSGMSINMVPILTGLGADPMAAAALVGLVGIGSIAGRLLGGLLMDRVQGHFIGAATACVLCLAIMCFTVFPASPAARSIGVLGVGLSIGVEFDVAAYLTARYFGLRAYGTVFGALSGVSVLMTGLGPLLSNFIFDITGSYAQALWLFVPISLLAGIAFLLLGRPNGK